ncbi:N6-adenosine-methyltransferase catalytic subunit-like [Ruditapes philippinarum]|uniref:N6-adenosine-methyltransferase catalytic subunit-like n=1 Tax=Ruditapes philippinarum TaxID=129788 RepID=UPI00295AE6D4|nr:N6-adenosine-methyltransferase catalytic subunit-like [Ruditapes philippinarum]
MTDAWNEIQALKSKQSSFRAKLAARKKEREGLVAEISKSTTSPSVPSSKPSSSGTESKAEAPKNLSSGQSPKKLPASVVKPVPIKHDPEVEKQLLIVLCDLGVDTPCTSDYVCEMTSKALGRSANIDLVENLLQKFAAQQMIVVVKDESIASRKGHLTVQSVDLSKLSAVADQTGAKRKRDENAEDEASQPTAKQSKQTSKQDSSFSVESLLSVQTAKERESKKMTEEIMQILSAPTTKEKSLMERFKSQGGAQLQEFCQFGTKEECLKLNQASQPCTKLHFRKIIHKHTDESLGDCSFLNTCFHMDTCKYVHYKVDFPEDSQKSQNLRKEANMALAMSSDSNEQVNMFPPQWIQCDIRYLDMQVLGKCAVIMADPPWDIHMELPYGTMQDDEMRKMPVPLMQDDGYIFLWVTGRAMELGRECLELWGYKRIDEIIWVKTNQLQRIIRTGRTGHWLNHGKEHCLVGVKGNPKGVNKGLDCDVIVAEVRATSHKPDEIYGIIERLSPGTRKVELFGRPHNVQPNWITLGNQLEGVRLVDPEIVKRFKEKYPDGNCMGPPKESPADRDPRDRDPRDLKR